MQPLGTLDVHRLHVAVQFLLSTLLVVPLPRDPHSQPVRHALDPGFPHLLVELGVEADVFCALWKQEREGDGQRLCQSGRWERQRDCVGGSESTDHRILSELLDLLYRPRGLLLERGAMDLAVVPRELVFRPNTCCGRKTSEVVVGGLHKTNHRLGRRTRLCRWMVYSRATTSAMAERPVFFEPGGLALEDSLGAIVDAVAERLVS